MNKLCQPLYCACIAMSHTTNSGQQQHAYQETVIAGAASGFLTRLCCQPLDVLKIRYQLGIRRAGCGRHFFNILTNEAKGIIHDEGLRALWKGHVPAQALSISYGMVQFTAFDWLRSFTTRSQGSYTSDAVINFSAGAVAGCVATIASFPFDTVRTRLVAQTEQLVYRGTFRSFATIVQSEGVFALYNGLFATLVQIAPYVGVQFAVYKFLDSLLKTVRPDGYPHEMHFVIGAISGATAKTAVYPLDLVKKRLQMRGANHPLTQLYSEKQILAVLKSVLTKDGYTGLYKGLSFALLKAVVSTGLSFYFYESALCYAHRARDVVILSPVFKSD